MRHKPLSRNPGVPVAQDIDAMYTTGASAAGARSGTNHDEVGGED